MFVSFIEYFAVNEVLEPPQHPHLTIKKKFKLLDINERQLIDLMQSSPEIRGVRELRLGDIKNYDNDDNKYIEVTNSEIWIELHKTIVGLLIGHIESRDQHYEGENYLPHVTWRLKGEITLDPKPLIGSINEIKKLYLIERIDPVVSRSRIVSVIDL